MVSRVYGGENIGKRRFELVCERATTLLEAVGHQPGVGIRHDWGEGNVLGGGSSSASTSSGSGAGSASGGGSAGGSSGKKRQRAGGVSAAEEEEQRRKAQREAMARAAEQRARALGLGGHS